MLELILELNLVASELYDLVALLLDDLDLLIKLPRELLVHLRFFDLNGLGQLFLVDAVQLSLHFSLGHRLPLKLGVINFERCDLVG